MSRSESLRTAQMKYRQAHRDAWRAVQRRASAKFYAEHLDHARQYYKDNAEEIKERARRRYRTAAEFARLCAMDVLGV